MDRWFRLEVSLLTAGHVFAGKLETPTGSTGPGLTEWAEAEEGREAGWTAASSLWHL